MVRRATRFSAASCPGSVERAASVNRLMRIDGTQTRVRVSRQTSRCHHCAATNVEVVGPARAIQWSRQKRAPACNGLRDPGHRSRGAVAGNVAAPTSSVSLKSELLIAGSISPGPA